MLSKEQCKELVRVQCLHPSFIPFTTDMDTMVKILMSLTIDNSTGRYVAPASSFALLVPFNSFYIGDIKRILRNLTGVSIMSINKSIKTAKRVMHAARKELREAPEKARLAAAEKLGHPHDRLMAKYANQPDRAVSHYREPLRSGRSKKGTTWIYSNGRWEYLPTKQIVEEVRTLFDKMRVEGEFPDLDPDILYRGICKDVSVAYAYKGRDPLLDSVPDFKEKNDRVPSYILKNSQVSIDRKTNKLVATSLDPMAGNLYTLGIDYDPKATCPRFDAALKSAFPGDPDLQQYAVEMFGFALQRAKDYANFLLCVGSEKAGRQGLIDIISAVGGDVVLESPISEKSKKFSSFDRLGKRILLDSTHIPADGGPVVRVPHKYTENKDVRVEPKWRNSFAVRFHLMMIFNSNHYPRMYNPYYAVEVRTNVIPFTNESDDSFNKENVAYIIKNELPGVFNRLVAGYASYLVDDRFTESKTAEAAKKKWLSMYPVPKYIQRMCIV